MIAKQFENSVNINIKKLSKNLEDLLENVGKAMVSETRRLQDQNNNYASRSLSNKTNAKVKGLTITFGSNASNNGYNYGIVQEFGRKPGKGISEKGQEDIVKWIFKKIRLGHFGKIKVPRATKRTRLSLKDRKLNVAKGIAFLMSQKMKEEGYTGKLYYKAGFDVGSEMFNANIDKVMQGAFK